MRAWWRRLLATVRRNKADRDLDAELGFHLQSLADEFETRGLDRDAARLAARRAFGGVEQIKEVYRDRRGLPLVNGALSDLRHTARSLVRSPGFTATVVVTIALAIGANAAVFLLLDQVVLRQLPVAQPSELVIVSAPPLPVEIGHGMGSIGRSSDGQLVYGVSYPLYQTVRKRVPLFQDVLAHGRLRPTLLAGTTPMLADAELVTGNYFDMLGVKAAIGRTLRPDDDRAPVGNPVAVLSHGFWQREFGSDPSVLDRTIRINNYPLTVVGVVALGFSGTEGGRGPDLFVPLAMSNQVAPIRGYDRLSNEVNNLDVIARLAPGVSREQAEKYLRGVYEPLFDEAAGRLTKPANVEAAARLKARKARPVSLFPGGYASSAQSAVTRELKWTLELLMAMVALVLLIAAGNVTNLLVARGAARARDTAIRLAIGADRWRLLRERLAESLVLALVAGIASLFVTEWVVQLLPLVLPFGDRATDLALTPDRRVVVFTFLVAIATGLYLWLTSALQVTRRSSLPLLHAGAARQAGPGKPLRLRRGLVVVQVALSLGLLCASALLARSLFNLVTVDPGFKVEGLSAFSVQQSGAGDTAERRTVLLRELLDNVRGLPGVQAASLTSTLPFTGSSGGSWASIPGVAKRITYEGYHVGPDYFRTIGMPLVAGRDFGEQDVPGAEKVAVVNEALVSALFGDGQPIGQLVSYEEDMPAETRIVGIAKDVKAGPRAEARPTIYLPSFQRAGPATMNVVARMTGGETLSTGSVRSLMKRLDPSAASSEPRMVADYIAEALLRDRMLATLSAFFALLALVLTGIGLFGLTSFAVAHRSREIGIRLALGAARRSIMWLVVKEVAMLTVTGGAIGLAVYVSASRTVGSFLFGLSATDPPTVAAATIVLAAIAFLAGFIPVWRATHLDPALTLRNE